MGLIILNIEFSYNAIFSFKFHVSLVNIYFRTYNSRGNFGYISLSSVTSCIVLFVQENILFDVPAVIEYSER